MMHPRQDLPDLDLHDRAALLALARVTIEARLGEALVAGPPHRSVFDRPAGAFVTVFVERALHGCVGLPDPAEALGAVVRYCARAAAFADPRFQAVTRADLAGLSLEISILTSFQPLADPSGLDVGRHGLLVAQGGARGLLLPQVATEHRWTREQFLDHTCVKAGLPPRAWRHGATLCRFEALVFGDRERS